MHLLLIFSFTLVASVLSAQYTNKFDNIDLDGILKNDRLLRNYADCLLDKGKCTKEGTELKKHVHEALETGCAKCSDTHKAGVRRVVKYLSENKKDLWNELLEKYDPDGTYRRKYQQMNV